MIAFVLRRLLQAIPTLFLVVTLAFFLIRVAPGGPFDLERPLEAKVMENLRAIYQLDRPLVVQYGLYLRSLAQGDLGPSFYFRDFTVADLFARGLPVSVTLGSLALIVALLAGGTLGSLAAFNRGSALDRLVVAVGTLGLTVPPFVVAPLLQIAFGLTLAWLPVGGWGGGSPRNLVLPVVTLALPQVAIIARLARAALIDVLHAHHIRPLRARGRPTRTGAAHALRGAALPVISYLGAAAAGLLTGSVVVETIFGLPGVGRYFVEGALNRDYTLVMGTVLLVAALVITLNLLADLACAWVDPRLRTSSA